MSNVKEVVLREFQKELSNTFEKDTVNKLYRQGRIWVRWQRLFAKTFTAEDAKEVNAELKVLRNYRINYIETHKQFREGEE